MLNKFLYIIFLTFYHCSNINHIIYLKGDYGDSPDPLNLISRKNSPRVFFPDINDALVFNNNFIDLSIEPFLYDNNSLFFGPVIPIVPNFIYPHNFYDLFSKKYSPYEDLVVLIKVRPKGNILLFNLDQVSTDIISNSRNIPFNLEMVEVGDLNLFLPDRSSRRCNFNVQKENIKIFKFDEGICIKIKYIFRKPIPLNEITDVNFKNLGIYSMDNPSIINKNLVFKLDSTFQYTLKYFL